MVSKTEVTNLEQVATLRTRSLGRLVPNRVGGGGKSGLG
jgi:hypothetical protein